MGSPRGILYILLLLLSGVSHAALPEEQYRQAYQEAVILTQQLTGRTLKSVPPLEIATFEQNRARYSPDLTHATLTLDSVYGEQGLIGYHVEKKVIVMSTDIMAEHLEYCAKQCRCSQYKLAIVQFVHELVHAMQDQLIDFQAKMEHASLSEAFIFLNVVEGHATLFEVRASRALGIKGYERMISTPSADVVISSVYESGYEFIRTLTDENEDLAWRVLSDLPTDTIQIRQPELYIRFGAQFPKSPPNDLPQKLIRLASLWRDNVTIIRHGHYDRGMMQGFGDVAGLGVSNIGGLTITEGKSRDVVLHAYELQNENTARAFARADEMVSPQVLIHTSCPNQIVANGIQSRSMVVQAGRFVVTAEPGPYNAPLWNSDSLVEFRRAVNNVFLNH